MGELSVRPSFAMHPPAAHVERMAVEAHRFNVFAHWGEPVVTLSTHMDTVPPFFASREDDEFIWGRGACDTKGIIAAMITAVERMLAEGERRRRPVVCGRRGAQQRGRVFAAAKQPRGSRFLINGEPTENKLALGSKGALRFEIDRARKNGAFGVSASGRIGDREIAGRVGSRPEDPVAARCGVGPEHGEYRHHSRRPRAERDSGFRQSRDFLPPGG